MQVLPQSIFLILLLSNGFTALGALGLRQTFLHKGIHMENNNRFTMTFKVDDKEFHINYPPNITYQEAFNMTLNFMLKIYDISKQVQPVTQQPIVEKEPTDGE
jgi:hypothetical protein